MTPRGRDITPVLTGFAAPVVALGVHAGAVSARDVTGSAYRTALG